MTEDRTRYVCARCSSPLLRSSVSWVRYGGRLAMLGPECVRHADPVTSRPSVPALGPVPNLWIRADGARFTKREGVWVPLE